MNLLFLFLEGDGGSSLISTLPMFLIIFAIFYFLVIMPQRKKQKELQTMVAELKTGEEVITNGGIIGKIIEVRDTSFIVRSADKSNLEIAKSAVVGRKPTEV